MAAMFFNQPELVQDIIGKNLLIKFHEDQTINVSFTVTNAPPPDIIGTNLLTIKNARPLVPMILNQPEPISKLIQDFIRTNLLTKFYEDRTINVASSMLTRKIMMPHNEQKAITKKLTMSTL
ncbi:hypothetical protein DPMN_177926 [Dreissena polymorpha]|uniref:Uncharacterized protein n=1 Tax=Dreissena polymorpha TaxID=45954 RepID=A0A9D4EBY8_DREPO|nr:hypothetical protein DPMN_177926 [Dreissena polymorpha]